MTDRDLTLPPVEAVDGLPVEALPGFVCRLSALLAAAGARLASALHCPSPAATGRPCYVTQTEAAAMFGISLADVRYLTRRGIIPAIGRGKNKRLLPADLERHLARCARARLAVRGIPDVSCPRDRRRGAAGPQGARHDATDLR